MAASVNSANGTIARIERVRALMDERGYDAVVIRDEANLRWLTGAEGVFDFTGELPHAAFITADEALLHTDSRYFNSFTEHLPAETPWTVDEEGVRAPCWVAERAAAVRARAIALEDTCDLAFHRALVRALEDGAVAFAIPLMHGDLRAMRAVKDAEEVELMRCAQAITDAAFEHMLAYIEPGLTERQVKFELENYMFSQGADSLAFSSIVASGPNAANPHAIAGDRVIERGDFVLMDYGAGYRDYKSDMTRTVCVGEPTARQREVYDIVRRTHEECAKAAHAGVDGREVHELSRRLIAEAGYGAYYGHGLGHGVGIDIHELPVFGRSGNTVEAGAVITIEPGIYLPGEFGVRLEDFGLITEEGFVPFTRSPHELQVIAC